MITRKMEKSNSLSKTLFDRRKAVQFAFPGRRNKLTKRVGDGMMKLPRKGPWALLRRRFATPLRKGVKLMGNRRWAQALRFLVCLLITLAVMLYISPKAC